MANRHGQDDLSSLRNINEAAQDGNVKKVSKTLKKLSPALAIELLLPCPRSPVGLDTPLVTAAENGRTEVVELLLEYQSKHCEHDHAVTCAQNSVNALSRAALHGHLDVVKTLVQRGVDANSVNSLGDTALHRVCVGEDLTTVTDFLPNVLSTAVYRASTLRFLATAEYLVCNGAIIDMVDASGETYVFGACRSGQEQLVNLLLEKGADLNHTSASKSTPLHAAVHWDTCAVANMLLKHNATFSKDANGRSPLTVAALCRSVKCLEFFLTLSAFSRQEKVDALELLGGTFAVFSPEKTYLYLKRAMDERYRDPADILLKPHRPPVAALGNLVESQTLEELESKRQDHDTLQLESLLAMERILGPEDTFTGDSYRKLIQSRRLEDRHSDAISLWNHARDFMRGSNSLGYTWLTDNFFEYMIQQGSPPSFCDFFCVLKVTVTEMESQTSADDKHESFVRDADEYTYFCVCHIWGGLPVVKNEADFNQLRDMTNRLMNVLRSLSKASVLHFAIDKTANELQDWNWSEMEDASFISLVDFLVKCGANPNQKNENADSPLHCMMKYTQSVLCKDNAKTACSITKILLEAGAHVDSRNKENQTPLEVPDTDDEVRAMLLAQLPLSLQCLAASAIVQEHVPYHGAIPTRVENFIKLHSPHQ